MPPRRLTCLCTALALNVLLGVALAAAPPGDPVADAVAATCRLEVPLGAVDLGNGLKAETTSCGTATVVRPRRKDGKWDVLTALHVFARGRTKGVIKLRDGRSFGVTLRSSDAGSDLAWAVTDRRVTRMPAVRLCVYPTADLLVWHNGYGWDQPENVEHGALLGHDGGMLRLKMSVSQGDSGGGVFDGRGNLLGVVSCTTRPASRATMWAGAAYEASLCRPK